MDLQTAAMVVALASPLIVAGAAWGTLTAQMKHLRSEARRAQATAERAHLRIDSLTVSRG